MEKIKINAFAKLNLFLEVVSCRSDGYHNIESIFCLINLKDTITIKRICENTIKFSCSDKSLESKNNLVYRAAELIKTKFNLKDGVEINLTKRIPYGSGLGGGSSDCAATMKAMVRLFNLKVSRKKLLNLGKSLGADVPFFLSGFKLAEVGGIGEKLKKIRSNKKIYFVVVKPRFSISTKWAYSHLILRNHLCLVNKKKIDKIKWLITDPTSTVKEIAGECFNRLEEVAVTKYPVLHRIKNALIRNGALNSLMTGSGSAVFGIFENKKKMEDAALKIPRSFGKIYKAVSIL